MVSPITALGPTFGFIGAGFLKCRRRSDFRRTVALFYLISIPHHARARHPCRGRQRKGGGLRRLNVNRIKVWVYLLAGGLAAVGGLIPWRDSDAADPKAGLGYERIPPPLWSSVELPLSGGEVRSLVPSWAASSSAC